LGANATVYLGFQNTSYPEDYVVLFKGIIQGVQSVPGMVHFQLANTEAKKKAGTFTPRISQLRTDVGTTAITTLPVVDGTLFSLPVDGPSGDPDEALDRYVKIDDELFSYTGTTANTLTGVVRSQLGSQNDEHDAEADVQSVYRLQGNGIELALKIMLSGWNGPFVEEIPVEAFNQITPSLYVENGLLLKDIDAEQLYGITVGDYVTITGAANAGNNITAKQIGGMTQLAEGTLLLFTGVTFVDEVGGSAEMAIRSQYDTLGQGLKLSPAEVDVAEHQRLFDLFVGGFVFDFTLDEIPNTKEWIEKQLYLPMACFSVPRKGRSSVAFHIGPIGGDVIPVLNRSNVTNADKLKLERSTASNFYNTVKYSYDFSYLDGRYRTIKVYESAESKTRIPVGDVISQIQAEGMKSTNDGATYSNLTAEKLLGRYQFGAEFFKGMGLLWGVGFPLEIGDIVAVDFASLKQTDVKTGDRNGGIKLFEVINKTMDIRLGEVTVDLVSTTFGNDERYATFSPASLIGAGATTTRLPLQRSFGTEDYEIEGVKWQDYIGEEIRVHSPDYSFDEIVTLFDVDLNDPSAIVVSPALSLPPGVGYTIEAAPYPDSEDPADRINWKTRHAFWSPTVAILSSLDSTHFEVDPADIAKFKVGATVQIHNEDYSDDSGETLVVAVDTGTNVVEFKDAVGFTITTAHKVDFIGFADGGAAYRWV
jgi:hypothetical protein